MSDTPQWPVACATGHRALPAEQYRWVEAELFRVADKLKREHGCGTAVSGMALGADQLWAEQALFAELRLHAVLPFPGQAGRWPAEARDRWQQLLDAAAVTSVVSPTDPQDKVEAAKMLHQRNDKMLVISDVVVAVADRGVLVRDGQGRIRGGTWSAVDKAVKRELPIIWLDPAWQRVTLPTPQAWQRILAPMEPA